MKAHTKTVRRSIAVPAELIAEAMAVAPPPSNRNLNRLTITALREFVERHRAQAFASAMAEMAADPAIRAACAAINEQFSTTEGDGLGAKK